LGYPHEPITLTLAFIESRTGEGLLTYVVFQTNNFIIAGDLQ
jgi:hypothetical protein